MVNAIVLLTVKCDRINDFRVFSRYDLDRLFSVGMK